MLRGEDSFTVDWVDGITNSQFSWTEGALGDLFKYYENWIHEDLTSTSLGVTEGELKIIYQQYFLWAVDGNEIKSGTINYTAGILKNAIVFYNNYARDELKTTQIGFTAGTLI